MIISVYLFSKSLFQLRIISVIFDIILPRFGSIVRVSESELCMSTKVERQYMMSAPPPKKKKLIIIAHYQTQLSILMHIMFVRKHKLKANQKTKTVHAWTEHC